MIDVFFSQIHRVLTWKGKTWTSDFICTTLNACVKKPAGEALSESAAQAERHHGNTMDTRSATSDNETVEIMKIVQFGDLHTNLEYAEVRMHCDEFCLQLEIISPSTIVEIINSSFTLLKGIRVRLAGWPYNGIVSL